MLSIKPLGAADSELAAYYEDLAHDDYYQNGGEPPGIWQGQLCSALALTGSVKRGQLKAMFEGLNPITGEPLARNAGQGHKAGWDLTFSAPKSVSLIWALADDELNQKLSLAHDDAVNRALAYLELNAFRSRDRTDPTAGRGALVAAVFQHSTSRALDPQLHSHVVVGNLGRRLDGSWCALDFDTRWKMAAGALYRSELAHRLQELGYGIERDGSCFRIAGVTQSETDAFSKRRVQILEALKQSGHSSAKAASVAALSTRVTKTEVDRNVLRLLWRSQAHAIGLDDTALSALREPQHCRNQIHAERLTGRSTNGHLIDMETIVRRLTHASSTFTRMQFEAAIITDAQGILNADQVENLIDTHLQERQKDTGPLGLLRLRHLHDLPTLCGSNSDKRRDVAIYTTREMLVIEQSILQAACNRRDEIHHYVSAVPGLGSAPFLTIEQTEGLRHVTESAGAVKVLCGLAGTGKSTLLAAAKVSWEAQGFQVIGAALSGKAADSLQAGSNIPSQTLHSLLHGLKSGDQVLEESSLLVIDEAAMVGSRQLKQVLDKVHAAGAKVVLVGDAQQLQPIEAGGMFSRLALELGSSELSEIRRQNHQDDREFILRLVRGEIQDTLAELASRGILSACPARSVHRSMVSDWLTKFEQNHPERSLMLAGTRSDAHQLNLLARVSLKEQQLLGSDSDVTTSKGIRAFAVGERILFTRNSRALGLRNGQTGTLVEAKLDHKGIPQLTIHTDAHKNVTLNTAEYADLDYGYAVTLHKAQGQSVDQVWVLLSESMADREWTYVSASRHRESLKVFAPQESLAEISVLMQVSRQKTSTLDYVPMGTTPITAPEITRESMEAEFELG